jgi:hypothetical protein
MEYQFNAVQMKCRELEEDRFRKEGEVNDLKGVISKLITLQEELTHRQTEISV